MVTSRSQNQDWTKLYLVCASACACVPGACVCVFGSAETLANPLCASQCPVSEELWPLSSCSLLKPQEKKKRKWESLRECKWVSVCAKTSPEGRTVRSETHRSTYSTVHALAHAQYTLTVARMRTRAARLVSLLCSARILLSIKWSCCNYISLGIGKSRGFRVQYIWLNRLQVQTCTVTTCLKQHFPVCVTVWYSASLFYTVIVWYTVY